MPNDPPPLTDLHGELAAHLTEATSADIPLIAGLRATAEDDVSKPLARALRRLADALERGVPFDEAVRGLHSYAPRRARAILLAARSGRDFTSILMAILEQERQETARRRELRQALAYPVTLVVLAYIVFVGIYFGVLAQYDAILVTDFDELFWPIRNRGHSAMLSAQSLFEIHMTARWYLLAAGVVVVFVPILLRVLLGSARFGRLVYSLPLAGQLWFHSRLASWAEILAVLLRARLPLPEALRLTASACHPSLDSPSRRAAEMVERGTALPLAIRRAGTFPASLALFCGASGDDGLAETIERTAEAFRQRYKFRADLVTAIARPIAFLVVVVSMSILFTFLLSSAAMLLRYLS